MLFTLQRYIFRELMKVFLLAGVALTLIMSLGSILRPVQEYGVGPRQVMELMSYFLPITLTFVLPMAALFAAALVYGRFASDNELDACRASGVSMMTLVYPGLCLAIIVAIANLLLSFYVMPNFVERAEKSLKADAQQIIFRNIQRKGYYKAPEGGYLIYADNADIENNTLNGVVITDISKGVVGKIITAESAQVKFNAHKKFNEVQIIPYNAYQMDPENIWFLGLSSFSMEFPSLLGDDIKFKKIDEMKRIKSNPLSFLPIEKIARQIRGQFTAELLAQDIATKTGQDSGQADANSVNGKTKEYYRLGGEPNYVEFAASNIEMQKAGSFALTGKITAIEYRTGTKEVLRTLECTKATLHIGPEEIQPSVTMEFYNPIWRGADGAKGLAGRYVIHGLRLPESVEEKINNSNTLEVINKEHISASLRNRSSQLVNLEAAIAKKIQKTLIEISAEIHSRLTFGIGCVSLILIGIGLGIIKKGGHLLSAFGVSSIPAAVLIVCIMMGKNIMKNPGSQSEHGIILMWLGPVLLTILAIGIYRRLLKT